MQFAHKCIELKEFESRLACFFACSCVVLGISQSARLSIEKRLFCAYCVSRSFASSVDGRFCRGPEGVCQYCSLHSISRVYSRRSICRLLVIKVSCAAGPLHLAVITSDSRVARVSSAAAANGCTASTSCAPAICSTHVQCQIAMRRTLSARGCPPQMGIWLPMEVRPGRVAPPDGRLDTRCRDRWHMI